MNKDVIYIEPEDDITDILAKVKKSENKIVALVPPKKAGVLRSAVNFKLIAKTANQNKKAVVLISSDASLMKLAAAVEMPVAKTLQSKPQVPTVETIADDENPIEDEVIEEAAEKDDAPVVAKAGKKIEVSDAKKSAKDDESKVKDKVKDDSKASKLAKTADMKIDGEKEEKDDAEKVKKSNKKVIIPNFQKYQKKIIVAVILVVAFIAFYFWAFVIAPAAKITVSIKTSEKAFNEQVEFVLNEAEADPTVGKFYLTEFTIEKVSTAGFEATGEEDKGTKATGTITVYRYAGEKVDESSKNYSIPKGTEVTCGDKTYVTTTGGSVNVSNSDLLPIIFTTNATLLSDKQSEAISIQAKEGGEDYNIEATTCTSKSIKYTIKSSDISGGTSKIVKVITEDDVEGAERGLDVNAHNDAKTEFNATYDAEYLLITASFAENDGAKITTSPLITEEVKDGIEPILTKTASYRIYGVKREDLKTFIEAKISESMGDNTQEIYETGADNGKAFFERYKAETRTATLKSTTKTGPRVTEDMVLEKAKGSKIGEVQSHLRSINGVSKVSIDTSFFWVTSVPDDANKVQIEITVE